MVKGTTEKARLNPLIKMEEMMGILSDIESKFDAVVKELTGQARRDLEDGLQAAKEVEAQIAAIVQTFEPQLLALLKDADPVLKQAAQALVSKLISDVLALVGSAVVPSQEQPPAGPSAPAEPSAPAS